MPWEPSKEYAPFVEWGDFGDKRPWTCCPGNGKFSQLFSKIEGYGSDGVHRGDDLCVVADECPNAHRCSSAGDKGHSRDDIHWVGWRDVQGDKQ